MDPSRVVAKSRAFWATRLTEPPNASTETQTRDAQAQTEPVAVWAIDDRVRTLDSRDSLAITQSIESRALRSEGERAQHSWRAPPSAPALTCAFVRPQHSPTSPDPSRGVRRHDSRSASERLADAIDGCRTSEKGTGASGSRAWHGARSADCAAGCCRSALRPIRRRGPTERGGRRRACSSSDCLLRWLARSVLSVSSRSLVTVNRFCAP